MATEPMRTLGTYLVELLEAYGVDTVFGIPGVHTVELYRGLAGSGIRHVTPRHEQGAGFMADGYARATGRPGVCFLITGPGLTNAATAIAQAYADSVPLLVISGVNAVGHLGSGEGHLHELPDQRQLMSQLTAFSHTVLDPAELEPALARAFALFASGRPRPVHIEIPIDLMIRDVARLGPARRRPPPSPPAPCPEAIAQAAAMLARAERPAIIAGGGAMRAEETLPRLAERLDAPVVMTVNGRGLLVPGHPLAVSGSPSIAGTRELLAEADMILALGTELGPTDFDLYGSGPPKLGGPLLRVDIDPQQACRGYRADLTIVADAGAAVAALLDRVDGCGGRDGAGRAAAARQAAAAALDPLMAAGMDLMDTVRDTLPGVVIVGDSTQPAYAGCLAFAAPAARSWFCSSTGYGTLGYALPAALGASIGVGDRPVVGIIGDGGLQFTLAELGSGRELDLPVILIVWNNRGYREIKTFMQSRGIQPVGVDIHTPDFLAIACAYGWEAARLEHRGELPQLLTRAAGSGQPTMILVDEELFLAAEGLRAS